MQPTSSLYQELLAGPHSCEVRLAIGETGTLITKLGESITFGGTSILIGTSGADGGYDESLLVSVSTNSRVFAQDTVGAGSCVSSEISVRMLQPYGEIPRQARLTPYVRLTDGTRVSEWIQKGVFYVDTREKDLDNSQIEYINLHGYDAMLKAEQDYPNGSLQWPAADIDVVREIAQYLNVSIDTRTFDLLTHRYSIQYPAGYSCREVLGYIAALYGGCFIMSDIGELRLVAFYAMPAETRYLVNEARMALTFGGDRILV